MASKALECTSALHLLLLTDDPAGACGYSGKSTYVAFTGVPN